MEFEALGAVGHSSQQKGSNTKELQAPVSTEGSEQNLGAALEAFGLALALTGNPINHHSTLKHKPFSRKPLKKPLKGTLNHHSTLK